MQEKSNLLKLLKNKEGSKIVENQLKSIVIGAGEVGRSLYSVLKKTYGENVLIRDKQADYGIIESTSILNICYPYSDSFVDITKGYIEQYNPSDVTIIHSTVPVGTTRKCGENCVHSPIHGKHPNLDKGIKTFTKFIGGEIPLAVLLAYSYLDNAGIKTKRVSSPEASELSKILCTTYYGWNIIFCKEAARVCEEFNVPFEEVYTNWNKEYNKGYAELGMGQFVRPVLEPIKGRTGGHCICNNAKLLSFLPTDLILERDEEYAKETLDKETVEIPLV